MATIVALDERIEGDGLPEDQNRRYYVYDGYATAISTGALEPVMAAKSVEGLYNMTIALRNASAANALADVEIRLGNTLDANGNIVADYIDIIDFGNILNASPVVADIKTLAKDAAAFLTSQVALGAYIQIWAKGDTTVQTLGVSLRFNYWI